MFLLFRFEHFPLVGRLGAVTLAVATALLERKDGKVVARHYDNRNETPTASSLSL